jgi:prevent-host-death family protein
MVLAMINISQDIHSLTAFKRNTSGLMKRLKRTRRPLVLTVKGKAEAVVMDPFYTSGWRTGWTQSKEFAEA